MTAPQTGRIFISYRRDDSAGYAGRIYDRLAAHFRKDTIFMDVDTIAAGVDFVEVLENAVQACDVLVALIGRQWLNIKDAAGVPRLDNPQDFVRIEIAAALKRGIRVIPVLVDGMPMPNSDQLPSNLKSLARRNAVLVNHYSFHNDASRLIEQLELALKAAEESKILKAKELKEKEALKKRQVEIENFLSQADIALDLQGWELAKEKLEAVLILDPEHAQAQVKLAIVERKQRETKEKVLDEERAKQEAAKKTAEEKAEREAVEKAAREKAEHAAAEKAAREKMEQEAAQKDTRDKEEPARIKRAQKEREERAKTFQKKSREQPSPELQLKSKNYNQFVSRAIKIVAIILVVSMGVWGIIALLKPIHPEITPDPPPEATAPPEPTDEQLVEPKVANFAWTSEPDSLNPLYSYSTILQQLYLCWAWEYNDQNLPYPHLVTEIPNIENGGLSEDGLTITLNLRDDIIWSDGTPITAADFKFTYDMIMDDSNGAYTQFPYNSLESVEIFDDKRLAMHFIKPLASWEAKFWQGILPAHILQPVYDAQGSLKEADWNQAPAVGCGPYVFESWQAGSFMHFVKNENYWKDTAKIDEITLIFVADGEAQTAMLSAGEVELGAFVPQFYIPTLQSEGLRIIPLNQGYAEGLFFNFREMASPAIKDMAVRQAIAMSIDRQAIIDEILPGLTVPANTLWDGLAAYGYVSPNIVPWEYDPEKAKALLDEAGYIDTDGDGFRENPDGTPLKITYGTTNRVTRQQIQTMIQQQVGMVGIYLDIQSFDADVFFGSYTDNSPAATGSLDIMEWSDRTDFPDPDIGYWDCLELANEENPGGFNYFGCDAVLSSFLLTQRSVLTPAARVNFIQLITSQIHHDVYWYGLFVDPDFWVINSNLTGVKLSGVTPLSNIVEWELAR